MVAVGVGVGACAGALVCGMGGEVVDGIAGLADINLEGVAGKVGTFIGLVSGGATGGIGSHKLLNRKDDREV